MCKFPGCTITGEHDILHRMENMLVNQGKSIARLDAEVFGHSNKPGLSAKVDRIMEGTSNVRKDAGKVSVIVSAITGAILIAVGKLLGLDVQGS